MMAIPLVLMLLTSGCLGDGGEVTQIRKMFSVAWKMLRITNQPTQS